VTARRQHHYFLVGYPDGLDAVFGVHASGLRVGFQPEVACAVASVFWEDVGLQQVLFDLRRAGEDVLDVVGTPTLDMGIPGSIGSAL